MTIYTLKKIWVFLKNYWWMPVGLIVIIFLFLSRNTETAKKILALASESYKKERKAVAAIEKQKQAKKEYLAKIYKEAMKEIETNYTADKEHLREEERKEAKRLREKYKDDPEQLAREYCKAFGIHLIEDEDEE